MMQTKNRNVLATTTFLFPRIFAVPYLVPASPSLPASIIKVITRLLHFHFHFTFALNLHRTYRRQTFEFAPSIPVRVFNSKRSPIPPYLDSFCIPQ
jgi:hypothetical protein